MEVRILATDWKIQIRGVSNGVLGWNMIWIPWYCKDDLLRQCRCLSASPSKGKSISICCTWRTEGFVPILSSFAEKKLSESNVDSNDDINGHVFEDWFENTLLKNLPQDRKVLIVMDNAKYHSRLSEKTPTLNMNKKTENDMISFITKHHFEIPNQFLRLPPNHCVFIPAEIVWNQLKHHAWHLNIYTSQLAKAVSLKKQEKQKRLSLLPHSFKKQIFDRDCARIKDCGSYR